MLDGKPYQTSTTGHKGVYLNKQTGKYIAAIYDKSRRGSKQIGQFPTIHEAVQSRQNFLTENEI